MSQHDYVIDNQSFPATRTDLNNALSAIVSQNSGASAPSTTYAYQLWYDTTNDTLKMRNSDDDAWIDLFDVNQTTDVATIAADGSGDISLGNFKFDSDQTVGASQNDYVLTYDNTSGKISLEPAAAGGSLVAFSVSLVDTTATGTTGHIQFNTVETNTNSCWDTTNYRFEAPQDGVYHFSFTGMSAGTAAGGQLPAAATCHVKLEKSTDSGSNWSTLCTSYNYKASTTGFHNQALSGTFTLDNGDYVRINVVAYYIYSNLATYALNPTFSGHLVG